METEYVHGIRVEPRTGIIDTTPGELLAVDSIDWLNAIDAEGYDLASVDADVEGWWFTAEDGTEVQMTHLLTFEGADSDIVTFFATFDPR